MADVPFSLFTAITVLSLSLWFSHKDLRWILLAAIHSGFALFTKKEGLAVFFVLVLSFYVLNFFSGGRSFHRRIGFPALLAGIPILMHIPWLLFTMKLPETFAVSHFSPDRFVQGLERLPAISFYVLQEMILRIHRWNIIWWIFFLACLLSIRSLFRIPRLFLFLVFVLYSAAIWIPIMTTPIPIQEILPSAMTRLFMHVLPVAVVIMQGQVSDITGLSLLRLGKESSGR